MRPFTQQNLLIGTILCGSLALGGLIAAQQASPTLRGYASVIDGDTIRIGATKPSIRILGIDAPELSQSCRDVNGNLYACGERSRERLEEFLRGKRIQCVTAGRDIYNRWLGFCTADGTDIAAFMIGSGLAIASGKGYEDLEHNARALKFGIWSGRFITPAEWRHSDATPR